MIEESVSLSVVINDNVQTFLNTPSNEDELIKIQNLDRVRSDYNKRYSLYTRNTTSPL